MINSKFSNLILATTIALHSVSSASNFAFNNGDLILGIQAAGGTGNTKNVFVNLGSGVSARNGVGFDTVKANIGTTLSSVFGANWYTRSDIWFGVLGNLNFQANSGVGSRPAVDGDPSRTWYVSQAASTAGSAALIPASTYVSSSLGSAGNYFSGMEGFLPNLTAQADGSAILDQSANQTEWNNSWTKWNPIVGEAQGASLLTFTGGVQQTFGKTGSETFIDLQRVLSTNTGAVPTGIVGGGTYVATVSISNTGAIRLIKASANNPEIAIQGGPIQLNTTAGTPSDATSFTVSGANMTAGVNVNAPTGFEVSTSSNGTFSSNITVGTSGTITSTPVYVRIPASATSGNYTGNITLSSTGATSKNIVVTGTVTASTPVISVSGNLTALSTTYGTASPTSSFTISGANMTAPITVTAPSGFEVSTISTSGFTNSITVPVSGTLANTTIHVRLSPTANAGTYSGNISLTSTGAIEQTIAIADSKIDKATPTITTNPSASEIFIGEKLEKSILSSGVAKFNGNDVEGTFTFEEPEKSPVIGTSKQKILFTPSQNLQINLNATPSIEINVTVNKSDLAVITSPPKANGTYLQNFSYQITAFNNPTAYAAPDLPTGLTINNTGLITGNQTKSGNYTVTIMAINGSGNYDRTINIVIAKANPTINREPSASVITYGQKLLESYSLANGLDGSASVNGSFVFNDPNIIPDAGPKEQSVIFRPVDQENFNNLTNIGVTVRVNKASPSVLPPSASDITYGQKLSESKLNNGSATFIGGSVPGRFEFQEPDKRLNAGEFSNQSIIFIPSSNNNFNNATANVTVKVNKATPIITPPLASDIKKGESLENSILTNGSASFNDTKILGQFEFQYPTLIPAVGNSTQSVRFIPEDTNFREVIFPLSVNVVGPPSPIITTHPSSVTTLQGSNATFEVQASGESISYQWYKNGLEIIGAKNNILTIQKVSLSDAADYTVVIKSTNGSDPITSNAAKLNFTFALPDVSINENGTTTLNANVLGEGLKYQWMKNGVPILGQTSSVLTFDKVKPEQSGSYSVELTDQNNKKHTSQNSKIDVNPLPVISSQPSNVSVYEGGNATMRVTTKGYSHSFQWNKDGMPILGETKNTLSFSDVISRDQGDYTVTITNSAGTITSRSARLRVLSSISGNENNGNTTPSITTPSITTHPASQTITDGGNTTLSVIATGGSLSYQWLRNGINITGANQSSFAINSASIDNAGDYSVIVYNSISFISSNVAKITVNAPEIDVQQPVGSALTSGNSKISFGTARVGKAGISRTFTIKNIGNLNLSGLTITKAGAHSKEYTITRLSRRILAPGEAITFRVTFKAKAMGLREASIRIASNDRDENPFIINLAGQGAR
jgi:hypothetical protein